MKLHLLEEKIEKASPLDFGNILDESFELFKKVWVQGLVINLLTVVFTIPCMFIFYVPMLFLGLSNPEAFADDGTPPVLLLFVMIPAYVIIFFLIFVLNTLMRAGFYRICKQHDLGISTSDNYFYYFKKEYLSKVFLVALMSVGIAFAAALLCMLPLFYVLVPLNLVPLFFAFNPDLSAKELLKASFKLGTKKWLLIFGLTIVAGFAAQVVGMFLCFVGVFVTASFSLIPQYMVYKKTIGFDEAEEEKPQENNTNENLFLK